MQIKKHRFREITADLIGRLLIGLIRIYQLSLSRFLGGQCKFVPSCSEYAKEAIGKYGPIKGSRLAVWRIMRCNPCSKGGFDSP
jgi:putative membrane protein insertion efficiency factor